MFRVTVHCPTLGILVRTYKHDLPKMAMLQALTEADFGAKATKIEKGGKTIWSDSNGLTFDMAKTWEQ